MNWQLLIAIVLLGAGLIGFVGGAFRAGLVQTIICCVVWLAIVIYIFDKRA